MKKTVIATIILLTAAAAALAHSPMNRFWGEVPVDMLLSGDVLIVKPLVIPDDVTLTIEQGTVVRFEDYGDAENRIVVRGKLVAIGTAASPVTFTHKDDKRDAWDGIVVEDGGGVMENCVIRGAARGLVDPSGGIKLTGVKFE